MDEVDEEHLAWIRSLKEGPTDPIRHNPFMRLLKEVRGDTDDSPTGEVPSGVPIRED